MTCSRNDHGRSTTSSAAAPLPTLSCTAESAKVLVTLLSCLAQTKRDQRVRCDVDRRGLLFTAHSIGKSLQVTTSIGRELFENYRFGTIQYNTIIIQYNNNTIQYNNNNTNDINESEEQDDEEDGDVDGVQLSFALNVHLLLECLSMFGPSALAMTSLRMTYEAEVEFIVPLCCT